MMSEGECFGHKIGATGPETTNSKVASVLKAPIPKNVQELRSFLGLVNYYGRFIPNLATIARPLNMLLRKDCQWKWFGDQVQAFESLKNRLASADVLTH